MADVGYWSLVLIVVPIVGAVVATIFFLLRLYSRYLSCGKLDVGDLFMGLGLLFCYGVTVCTVLAAFNGVGHDIWSLHLKTRSRVPLLFWITQEFWPLAQVFVKLSILVLLRKLLGSVTRWRITITILIIFTIAWGMTALIGHTFQCWPVQHFWLRVSVPGTCMKGQQTFFMAMGALSLVEDVVLLLLPIGVIWQLKMSCQQKLQVTVLFSFGGWACVFSLLRLLSFKHYFTDSITTSGCKEALWTLLELDTAIVCASLMMMRPLFSHCLNSSRIFCICRNKDESSSSPASDNIHFFKSWRSNSDASYAHSEMHSEAFHDPSARAANLGDDVIMIETEVVQCTLDRAEAEGEEDQECGMESNKRVSVTSMA